MKSHGNRYKEQGNVIVAKHLILIVLICLLNLGSTFVVYGDEMISEPTMSESSNVQRAPASQKEYSFDWLDPDKKIYVLQNRKFLKSPRLMFSLMGGMGLSHPYRSTYRVDPRIAYYLSESLGVEVFYAINTNGSNKTFEALQAQSPNALPVIREFKSEYGALAHWVPWYAKINVFNQILYFDWYFSGGLGQLSSQVDTNTVVGQDSSYVDQSHFGVYLGTGHQYHLSNNLTVRLDLTGVFYQAQSLGTTGDNSWFSSFSFNLGLGLRL